MTRPVLLALLLVISVALGVRLVVHPAMAQAADSFAPLVDSEAYLLQALRVADGAAMVDGVSFQAPLYPYMLGWLFRLSGVPGHSTALRVEELPPEQLEQALNVARALNLVLGVLTAALVFLLGCTLFSTAAGLASGLLAATYAPLLVYEGHLLKVSLSVLPLLLALLAAKRALNTERAVSWLPVGLCLGLGGLVRGNLYLVAQLGAVVLLLSGWRALGVRKSGARATVLLVGVGLAVLPMVLRNSSVAGRPVLSTAAGGTAFWLCNHAGNNTGLIQHVSGNRQVPRYELDDWRRLSEAELGRPLSAGEINRHWLGKALSDIANDPLRWLHVELRKLGLLFSRYEAPDNVSVRLSQDAVPLLAASPSRWLLVMPLGLAGLVLGFCRRRRLRHPALFVALSVTIVSYSVSLLLFIVTARFRMPLPVLALLPAGYFLASLPSLMRAGEHAPRWRVGGTVIVGFALAFASEGALGPLDGKELASHHMVRLRNRARVALRRGAEDAARGDLEAALRVGYAERLGAPAIFADLARLDRLAALRALEGGDPVAAGDLFSTAEQGVALALKVAPQHLDALQLRVQLLLDRGEKQAALVALADYDAAHSALGRSASLPEPAELTLFRAEL